MVTRASSFCSSSILLTNQLPLKSSRTNGVMLTLDSSGKRITTESKNRRASLTLAISKAATVCRCASSVATSRYQFQLGKRGPLAARRAETSKMDWVNPAALRKRFPRAPRNWIRAVMQHQFSYATLTSALDSNSRELWLEQGLLSPCSGTLSKVGESGRGDATMVRTKLLVACHQPSKTCSPR